VLSRVYDRWVAHHYDYERMAAFFAGGPARRALDVCCGTGSLALALAHRGVEVMGIDRSQPMLAVARARLPASVELMRLDVLTDPWPQGPFDLVVSTGDSVNYFAELGGFLAHAFTALAPGGRLGFDVNSAHKLRNIFADSVYAETFADYAYVWKNRHSPETRSVEFDIELFLAEADGRYRRFREVHRQRYWEADELMDLVRAAGFTAVEMCDDYSPTLVSDKTLRWTLTARRP
jgi:SAM-dependent methyltransferase